MKAIDGFVESQDLSDKLPFANHTMNPTECSSNAKHATITSYRTDDEQSQTNFATFAAENTGYDRYEAGIIGLLSVFIVEYNIFPSVYLTRYGEIYVI